MLVIRSSKEHLETKVLLVLMDFPDLQEQLDSGERTAVTEPKGDRVRRVWRDFQGSKGSKDRGGSFWWWTLKVRRGSEDSWVDRVQQDSMDAEEETDVRESEEIQDLRATVWLVFLVNLVLQVSLDLRGFLEKQAHQDPLCWEQLEREGPLETLEPPGPQDQQDPQGPEETCCHVFPRILELQDRRAMLEIQDFQVCLGSLGSEGPTGLMVLKETEEKRVSMGLQDEPGPKAPQGPLETRALRGTVTQENQVLLDFLALQDFQV